MIWLIVGFALIFIIAGVIVSVVTGTVFSWGAVLVIGGILVALFGGFVLVRLAE